MIIVKTRAVIGGSWGHSIRDQRQDSFQFDRKVRTGSKNRKNRLEPTASLTMSMKRCVQYRAAKRKRVLLGSGCQDHGRTYLSQ